MAQLSMLESSLFKSILLTWVVRPLVQVNAEHNFNASPPIPPTHSV